MCALSANTTMSKPAGSFSIRKDLICLDDAPFTGRLSDIGSDTLVALRLPDAPTAGLTVKDGQVYSPRNKLKPLTGTVTSLERGATPENGPFLTHHFKGGSLAVVIARAKTAPDGTIPNPGSNKLTKCSAVEPYSFNPPNEVKVIKSGWDTPGKKRAGRKW